VQIAIDNFPCILQHAAKVATPCRNPQRPTNTIPSNIKKLVVVKERPDPTGKNLILRTADTFTTKRATN